MNVFSKKGLEEEVVELSRDVSRSWCAVSVCELAFVPSVSGLCSPVNVVCDVDLSLVSDSDCELVKPQFFTLSKKNVKPAWLWSARQR